MWIYYSMFTSHAHNGLCIIFALSNLIAFPSKSKVFEFKLICRGRPIQFVKVPV